MLLLGKKLETFGSIVVSVWYIVQACGLIEDKRRARNNDTRDKKIQDLEEQITTLKAQVEKKVVVNG